jgi:signal transduction histidine kinase
MSSLADVIELPVRHEPAECHSLEHDTVLALATADDFASGMDAVLGRIRRYSRAARAEWWAEDEDGALELAAADGIVGGERHSLPLGPAGVFVLHDGYLDGHVESALSSLAPLIRRRAAEERLEGTTIQLAQRNEALEDFAALVAHELKTPLQAALLADDPSRQLEDALELVDALLQAAGSKPSERVFVSAAECVEQAVEDVGDEVEVTTDLQATLPLPPGPLRVILRNLLANAAAAGAHHVHVTAAQSSQSWRLLVDDDGVGLARVDRYAAGSGLGLSLSRRIAGRFGGDLELAPRASGGTRAILEFPEAA